jgi:hypothetical protein
MQERYKPETALTERYEILEEVAGGGMVVICQVNKKLPYE